MRNTQGVFLSGGTGWFFQACTVWQRTCWCGKVKPLHTAPEKLRAARGMLRNAPEMLLSRLDRLRSDCKAEIWKPA